MGGEDTEDSSWVIYTVESTRPSMTNLGFNSSGCIVRNNTPLVRPRWTDQDLVALRAD
jgi:hypothetical protein